MRDSPVRSANIESDVQTRSILTLPSIPQAWPFSSPTGLGNLEFFEIALVIHATPSAIEYISILRRTFFPPQEAMEHRSYFFRIFHGLKKFLKEFLFSV